MYSQVWNSLTSVYVGIISYDINEHFYAMKTR